MPAEEQEGEGSIASSSEIADASRTIIQGHEINKIQQSTELDFTQIMSDIQKLNLPDEDKQQLERYISTVVYFTKDPYTRALAYECLQFVFRFLNPDTFISEISVQQFQLALLHNGWALYEMVHLKYGGTKEGSVIYATRNALFQSTFSYMEFLLSRIVQGRNKRYNVDIATAKTAPKIYTGQGGH